MIPMFVYQFRSVLSKLLCVAFLSIGLLPSLFGQIIHLPTASVLFECDLDINLTSLTQTCDGAEACLNISGGTPPYTIRFSNNDTNPTPTDNLDVCFPNLQPGTYTVKVEDDEDCTKELSFSIPFVDYYIPAHVSHISCYGASDGAIDLDIEIDLAPLFFSWEGPNGFTAETEDIEGLEAGVYAVSISTTDDLCVGIGYWEIREPEPIQIDVRVDQPDCGQPDVCVYISGGTPPYYIWVFDVVPDIYADSPYGTITDWSDLDPAAGVPYDPSTIDGPAFCAQDVADGVYYIFVVDLHFCYAWKRVEIQGNPGFIREVDVQSGTCENDLGGSICFKIDGGTPPYATTIYPSVTDEAIIGDHGCFDNLAAGVYELRTVDGTGCSLVERYEIAPSGAVEAKLEITSPPCSDQINACLFVHGGQQPYRIFAWYWPTPPFAEPQISFSATGEPLADGAPSTDNLPFGPPDSPNEYRRCVENIPAGYYVIVVVDANGCYDVLRELIHSGNGLNLRTSVEHVSCYDGNDGLIELKIEGGFPPYTIAFGPNDYQIIDGDHAIFRNLRAGTYHIKVEDRQGCTARTEVDVYQPDPIHAEFEITSPACSGQVDGCLRVYGGTFPYDLWVWRWDNIIDVEPHVVFDDAGNPHIDGASPTDEMDFGPNTADVYRRCAEDIPPGYYLILIVDANRCYKLIRVYIPPAGELHLRAEAEPAACNNHEGEKIYLKIDGGTAPYTLILSNGDTYTTDAPEFVFENLSAGNYTIKVISADGCEGKIEVQVPDAPDLEARFEIISPPCSDQVSGCLFIEGGTRPYHIFVWLWDNATTVDPVVYFDADGHPHIDGADPTDAMEFDHATFGSDVLCARDIPAGYYLILVVDANGCYDLLRVNIPPPNGLELAYEVEPASCYGEYDGKIHLKIIGGEAPYTLVLWDGVTQILDGNEISFEGLSGGIYPITVYDQNQCSAAVRIEVPGGERLETVLDFDPYGSYACIEVLNGTAPYAYSWYDLSTNEVVGEEECVADLSPSVYVVEVKDEAGCYSADVFFIDAEVCQGGIASVSPSAIRSGATTTFYLEHYHGDGIQWQFRTRDIDWLNIPGATSAIYETPPMYAGSDRLVQIRAIVYCEDGDAEYSSTAEFKIYGHVLITQLEVGLLQDRRLFDPSLGHAARQLLAQQESTQEAQVFPTISSDVVNVQFPVELQSAARIWLSNGTGKMMQQLSTSDQMTQLDVSSLLPGIYFLKMEYNGQVEVRRVVVP